MPETCVSVIIPVFQATATLRRGLASVDASLQHARTNGLDLDVEAILAIDDANGDAYLPLAQNSPALRVRIVPCSALASGPSRARNRALSVAQGELIAFLDADDTWSIEYLAQLVPLARRHGAGFGRTRIVMDRNDDLGAEQLDTFPQDQNQSSLTLDDISHWSGSFHPLVHCDYVERNILDRAQDVWNAVMTLAKLGGKAPLAEQACYQLHLRPGSMTTDDNYSAQIDACYGRLSRLAQTHPGLPDPLRGVVASLWQQKSAHNQQFMAAQKQRGNSGLAPWQSFYHWRSSSL